MDERCCRSAKRTVYCTWIVLHLMSCSICLSQRLPFSAFNPTNVSRNYVTFHPFSIPSTRAQSQIFRLTFFVTFFVQYGSTQATLKGSIWSVDHTWHPPRRRKSLQSTAIFPFSGCIWLDDPAVRESAIGLFWHTHIDEISLQTDSIVCILWAAYFKYHWNVTVQHIPLTKTDVLHVVEIVVACLLPSKRARVSFKDKLGLPSYKWLQDFLILHSDI